MAIGGTGGSVGGVNLEVTASPGTPTIDDVVRAQSEAAEKAFLDFTQRANKEFENLQRKFGERIKFQDPFSDQVVEVGVKNAGRALNDLKRGFRELESITKGKNAQLFPDLEQQKARILSAIKAIEAQITKARVTGEDVDIIFDLGGVDEALKQLQVLERQLANLQKSQEKRGFSAVAEQQISALKQQILDLNKALGIVGKNATFADIHLAAKKAAEPTGFFGRAVAGVNDRLKEMGLSVSGVAVLLGAGFAGGLAGGIQIATQFVQALARIAAEERELARQTRLTFGPEAIGQIEDFADSLAGVFGESENEIQKTINDFGLLGIRIGLVDDEVDNVAKGFGELANLVRNAVPGVETLADATKLITAAVQGDVEAFRQMGLTTAQVNEAAQRHFGKTIDRLTDMERAIILLDEGLKTVAESAEEIEIDPKKLLVTQTLNDLKNGFASAFNFIRDVVVLGIQVINVGTANAINGLISLTNLAADAINLLIKAYNAIPLAPNIPEIPDIPQIDTAELFHLNEYYDAIEGGTQSINDQTAAVNDLAAANARRRRDEFFGSRDSQQQAEDAIRGVVRAEEDGARRIQEARINLQRAYEDAAKKERDVRKQNQRQLEDANKKLLDAEVNLQRAREDRLRKIRDFHIDHNRKLEDLLDREKEVRKSQAKEVTEALISIADAQRKGDLEAENQARRAAVAVQENAVQQLADIERDLAREREDRIRELGDLEIDTNRQIYDAHKQVEEGLRDRQRAIEDAIDRLHDLEVENNRAIADAQRGLENAARDTQRAMEDAVRSVDRLAQSLGLTVEKMKEYLDIIERMKNTFPEFSFETFRPAPPPPQLMAGGPFSGPFIAGEGGPELVIPEGFNSGHVINNKDFMALLRNLANSQGQIIVNEVANDPEATAFAVQARLTRGILN